MILLQALMASGLLYAGVKTARQLRQRGFSLGRESKATPSQAATSTSSEPETNTLPVSQRHLVASSVSLGLAGTGALLHLPVLGAASLPVVLYVFTPVFRNTANKLVKEGKVDYQVLIASRVAVCVVMNYTVIAALDAFLHATSQRVFALKEAEFRNDIRSSLPVPVHALLHNSLEQAALRSDDWQKKGESQGEVMAPLMLATFVLTTPLLGINHAAAFLTTTFGAHLRHLGPYTGRQVISQGAQQGVLVLHPDALSQVAALDTLLVDEHLWLSRDDWQNSLKQQSIDVYLLTDADAITLPLGVAGSFQISAANDQQAIANRLQVEGRKVAYLSDVEDWLLGASAHQLQFSTNLEIGAEKAGTDDVWAKPGIVLLGGDPQQLSQLWALARDYDEKQRFNLVAPTRCDFVDIGTTVLLDFNLLYSVLFTYAGIGLGVAKTDKGRSENLRPTDKAKVLNSVEPIALN